jgi:hypothetical protein
MLNTGMNGFLRDQQVSSVIDAANRTAVIAIFTHALPFSCPAALLRPRA